MAEKITLVDGELQVPDNPIIPFIEGDGTGVDIWPAAQLVLDAAAKQQSEALASFVATAVKETTLARVYPDQEALAVAVAKGEVDYAVMGPLEFTLYAIATAKTIADLDPQYFASNLQFKRFTAWNIKRAMALYEQGRVMSQFTWADQDAYAVKLRTGVEAEGLRQFARATWGASWCQTILGF